MRKIVEKNSFFCLWGSLFFVELFLLGGVLFFFFVPDTKKKNQKEKSGRTVLATPGVYAAG